MATDDVSTSSIPCQCGKGTIEIEQRSPDHPWARESQTSYSAKLDCDECAKLFVVRNEWGKYPTLLRKADVAAQVNARADREAVEARVAESSEGKRLVRRIVSVIDAQPSVAARYRELKRFNLIHNSEATYRKHPIGGKEAVKRISGGSLARIGSLPDMGETDAEFFKEKATEIEKLYNAERSLEPRPVKTGDSWMRA